MSFSDLGPGLPYGWTMCPVLAGLGAGRTIHFRAFFKKVTADGGKHSGNITIRKLGGHVVTISLSTTYNLWHCQVFKTQSLEKFGTSASFTLNYVGKFLIQYVAIYTLSLSLNYNICNYRRT